MTDKQQPPQEQLVVALVCKGRQEASLNAAVSLLNLQTRLAQTEVKTEVHIVESLNDAMSIALAKDAHLFAFETTIGFTPDFALEALASGKEVVVAPYPLPAADWDRLKAAPPGSKEPFKFRANVYSATPAGDEQLSPDGYVPAASAHLGCVFVRRGVAADILARHPEVAHEGGGKFAFESVHANKACEPHETFGRLFARPVWIDLSRPATLNGPMAFAGSVGMRHVLR